MTALHHTPIANGQPGNQDTFNGPLGQLDDVIDQIITGLMPFSGLNVYGDVLVADDLTVGSDVVATGQVSGAEGLFADVNVTDDLSVTGTATLPDADVGVLDVSGTTTLAGASATSFTVSGATTTNGVLNVEDVLRLGAFSSSTLASDAFAATHVIHTLTAQVGTSDDLLTITGGSAGQLLIVRPVNSSTTIRVVHSTSGTNRIQTIDGTPVYLFGSRAIMVLVFNGTMWMQVTRPDLQMIAANNEEALTLASDTITVSRSAVQVDTESAAASDNMSTISSGVAGQLLFIRSTSAARVVTVKHNTGNIKTRAGTDFQLSDPNKVAVFQFNGTWWMEISGADISAATNTITLKTFTLVSQNNQSGLVLPPGVERLGPGGVGTSKLIAAAANHWRMTFGWQVDVNTANGLTPSNTAITLTATGSPSGISFGSITPLAGVFQAAATANTACGYITGGTGIIKRSYEPLMYAYVSAPSSLASQRTFFGLTTASIGNVDTPAGSSLCFRASSVAGDLNWRCVSTLTGTITSTDSGVLIVANQLYMFEIYADATAAYFYIDGILVATHTTNLPTTGNNLQIQLINWTLTTVQNGFNISRFGVWQN